MPLSDPKISVFDGIIVADFVGRSFGHNAPSVEGQHPVRNLVHETHVVFDHHDARLEPVTNTTDQLAYVSSFLDVES
jgi:hypothetical protein